MAISQPVPPASARAETSLGRWGAERPVTTDDIGVVGQFNRAATLRAGHLLVVHLARNSCYQVDPESGRAEYLFTLGHEQRPFMWSAVADRRGRIFCSLSGARDPDSPLEDAVFGLAGAIVEVDLRLAAIRTVAAGPALKDPDSLQLIDDGKLLVCDFDGFGGSGNVYTVDIATGDLEVVVEGGFLHDPVSAYRDADGDTWVANAYMHYEYGHHGRDVEKDDGELLVVDGKGRQRVVIPRQSPANGSIVGVSESNVPAQAIVVTGDWPTMETSSVLRVTKATGEVDVLLSASAGDPRFYSTHVGLAGSTLWVGESYTKKLIGYDLGADAVVAEHDFGGVMGPFLGVASSFEGIESVSVVPTDLEP